MRFVHCLLTGLLLMQPLLASAKAVVALPIKPIVHGDVRYVVPNDRGLRAYVEAQDIASGRKLWTKTIFRHWYVPLFGTECLHYEWITSMILSGNQLVLTSGRGRAYTLDLRTRAVHELKTKPVAKIDATNF